MSEISCCSILAAFASLFNNTDSNVENKMWMLQLLQNISAYHLHLILSI
jgi:hypothetical protein